jgi:flagellar hook-length control protein FliK
MKSGETLGAENRARQDGAKRQRARRTGENTSLAFDQVMRVAKRQKEDGAPQQVGLCGFPIGSAQARKAEDAAILAMQAAGLGTSVHAVDAAMVHGVHADASAVNAPRAQHLGSMTPQQAMTKIVDEARKIEIANASRELHIELEPAHLGPLVVKIKVERGIIRTELRAKYGDAVTALESGSSDLQNRLAELGYAKAEVSVAHDEGLELTAISG